MKAVKVAIALALFSTLARSEVLPLECVFDSTDDAIKHRETNREQKGWKQIYKVDLTAGTVLHQDGSIRCSPATIDGDMIRCKQDVSEKNGMRWIEEIVIDRTAGTLTERYAQFPAGSKPDDKPLAGTVDKTYHWRCSKAKPKF